MKENGQYDTPACGCVDVGTLIDAEDSCLEFDLAGPSAYEQLDKLTALAQKVGKGNCQVSSEVVELDDEAVVRARFQFDCTAEKLIFQMRAN